MKRNGYKPRAKWGSKTRHGKPIVPSDGTLRPYIKDDVRPRLPKDNNIDAKIIFATMIAGGHDKSWSPFIRNKVYMFLQQ